MVANEALQENIDIGYKVKLAPEDARVADRLLYHGRLGGDIEQLRDSPMYFYAEAQLSSVFSEHIFINGDTFELATQAQGNDEYARQFLMQAPTVFAMRVSFDNPVVLDMEKLTSLAEELGYGADARERFVADFEDSEESLRTRVFSWARDNGHDSAIIVNDMTPEYAGGDWCFRTSYVAFEPRRQVRFATASPT